MLIVDGNSLVHRAYWASIHSGAHTFYNGIDITGTKAFITMLEKALKLFSDTENIVVFDSETPSWRKEIYKEYKSNRSETPEFLKKQFEYVKKYLDNFNLPYLEMDGAEGDDLIASICKLFPEKDKTILTGDHDLFQLIDNNTKVYLTIRGVSELEKVDIGRLYEKEGLSPQQIPDFKAIAGDKSDNVIGIRSIGKKTAKKLLDEYGSVENIYKNIEHIKQPNIKKHLIEDKEQCFLFKKVCTVNSDIPLNKEEIKKKLSNTPNIKGRHQFFKKYLSEN